MARNSNGMGVRALRVAGLLLSPPSSTVPNVVVRLRELLPGLFMVEERPAVLLNGEPRCKGDESAVDSLSGEERLTAPSEPLFDVLSRSICSRLGEVGSETSRWRGLVLFEANSSSRFPGVAGGVLDRSSMSEWVWGTDSELDAEWDLPTASSLSKTSFS